MKSNEKRNKLKRQTTPTENALNVGVAAAAEWAAGYNRVTERASLSRQWPQLKVGCAAHFVVIAVARSSFARAVALSLGF